MLKVMRTYYAHDKFQFLGKEGKGLDSLNEDQVSDYLTENCLRIILNALNWQKLVEWQDMQVKRYGKRDQMNGKKKQGTN